MKIWSLLDFFGLLFQALLRKKKSIAHQYVNNKCKINGILFNNDIFIRTP